MEVEPDVPAQTASEDDLNVIDVPVMFDNEVSLPDAPVYQEAPAAPDFADMPDFQSLPEAYNLEPDQTLGVARPQAAPSSPAAAPAAEGEDLSNLVGEINLDELDNDL
mgnify:CR=1 FL=1